MWGSGLVGVSYTKSMNRCFHFMFRSDVGGCCECAGVDEVVQCTNSAIKRLLAEKIIKVIIN